VDTDPPPLDASQQPLQNEVCQHLVQAYKELGYQIVVSTQGPSGTIYDWIDKYSVEGTLDPPRL
jgi:predicted ATPase